MHVFGTRWRGMGTDLRSELRRACDEALRGAVAADVLRLASMAAVAASLPLFLWSGAAGYAAALAGYAALMASLVLFARGVDRVVGVLTRYIEVKRRERREDMRRLERLELRVAALENEIRRLSRG